jgi:hypothetical protein
LGFCQDGGLSRGGVGSREDSGRADNDRAGID